MPGSRGRSLSLVALLTVLSVGAGLRFAGLTYDVRHPQTYDDQVFVNNVIEMVRAGDADHRYYEYPGLFFYLLAIPIAWVQPTRLDDPSAFLAARIVVATFGVLSIFLLYLVGTRLADRSVGLASALLLAVSPMDVMSSHGDRPDIVLQTLTLAAYLTLLGLGEHRRGDIRAGLGIGAATAIKFTGFLLFPSYVLARLQAPGPRLTRMTLVAAIAALVTLAATPYALLHPEAYLGGVTHQMTAQYQHPMDLASYGENLATYSQWLGRPLGIPLVALAALGTWRVLRQGYSPWLPVLLHLPVTIGVMSSAELIGTRFLIPVSGVVFLVAGLGIRVVSRGNALAATALALLAAIVPLRQSISRVQPLMQASPRDGALEWIEANLPAGARILETRPEALPKQRAQLIGADPRRYELLYRFPGQRGLQLLAEDVDLVITGPEARAGWSEELQPVFLAATDGEVLFQLKMARRDDRPRYRRMEVGALSLETSAGAARAGLLVDRDPTTAWSSGPMKNGAWIEARWDRPRPLARVELWIANHPSREPDLEILTRGPDGSFHSRTVVPGREPLASQFAAGRRASQVFLLNPEPVSGLRIRIADGTGEPWLIAEMELSIRAPNPKTEEPPGPTGR